MSTTEQDLCRAIRQGSEPAFEVLFRQHYAALCAYAHYLLADADDAEEEVQALLVHLWEKRGDLVVTGSLKAYLLRTVRNRCLNRLQHLRVRAEHRLHTQHAGLESVESPAQTLLGQELAGQLQAALQKLPTQCRLAFTLSRYEELTYAEIANQLGIAPKTVENQIGKALRLLRVELRDYLPLVLLWLLSHPA